MELIYLMGRSTDNSWECQGIFSSFDKAIENLKDGYWFVELPFDELLPSKTMQNEIDIYWQKVGDKIYKTSANGNVILDEVV